MSYSNRLTFATWALYTNDMDLNFNYCDAQ